MSNPGVITLSTKKLTNGEELRIEDNLGEAIHIHYEDIRLDLTVNEFRELVQTISNTICQLIDINNFNIKNYDPVFLDMFSETLTDLVAIEDDVINLEDIQIVRKGICGLPIIRGLKESHMYRALLGKSKEHDMFKQENMWNETNEERLNKILESIKKQGYPYNNNYMIFFNEQNIIRDGQHRAACLFYLYGNQEVPIKRFKFKYKRNNVSERPWLQVLFYWNKKKFKKVIKIFIHELKNLLLKVKNKVKRILDS